MKTFLSKTELGNIKNYYDSDDDIDYSSKTIQSLHDWVEKYGYGVVKTLYGDYNKNPEHIIQAFDGNIELALKYGQYWRIELKPETNYAIEIHTLLINKKNSKLMSEIRKDLNIREVIATLPEVSLYEEARNFSTKAIRKIEKKINEGKLKGKIDRLHQEYKNIVMYLEGEYECLLHFTGYNYEGNVALVFKKEIVLPKIR